MTKSNLLAAMLVAGALIIGSSCQKENKGTEKINETKKQTECTSCEEGKELALKIKSFDNTLQLARKGAKTGETMPIDEAIDQMELLINASHGFPFEEYGKRVKKKIKLNLSPDANGDLSTAQIASAYDQMLEDVKAAYAGVKLEEKGLAFVGLTIGEESKGETEIDVDITIGGSNKEDPFTECWYYGEDLGMCDGTYYLEKDGGDEIANVAAANNPIYSYNDCPGPDYRLVIDPLPSIVKNGYDYLVNGQHFLFFIPDEEGNGFTDEEMQLAASEMNLYYNRELELMYNMVPEENGYDFPNFVLVDCSIHGDRVYLQELGAYCLNHENNLTYAQRYWVEIGIIDPPTPIDN